MDSRGGPGRDPGKRGAVHPSWRRWEVGGGATYHRPRVVGALIVGEQDLGYVEYAGGAWEWHTRPVPGPQGDFSEGKCPTEFEARQAVEAKWREWEAA